MHEKETGPKIKRQLELLAHFTGRKVYLAVFEFAKYYESNFSNEFEIIEAQYSNVTTPNFAIRLLLANVRLIKFVKLIRSKRPDAVIIFCSGFSSIIEKVSWYALRKCLESLIFPRSALVMSSQK